MTKYTPPLRRSLLVLWLILSAAFRVAADPIYFADQPFHGPARADLPRSVEHDERGFDVAYIDFDQRGDFRDRDQLGYASHALKERAKGGHPIVLVEYVHGWHHNSAASDGDVKRFKELLALLASVLNEPGSAYGKYRVFGT